VPQEFFCWVLAKKNRFRTNLQVTKKGDPQGKNGPTWVFSVGFPGWTVESWGFSAEEKTQRSLAVSRGFLCADIQATHYMLF